MRQLSRRQRIAAIVLAALALCFITLDLGGGALSDAHSGVRGTLGSLYRGTDALLGPARRWLEGVPHAGSNEARISELEQRNAALRKHLAAARSNARVDRAVSALQQTASGTGHTILPARVIAYGPGEGFDWTVTLDVGTQDGVKDGQSVTDGASLVGRVLHADAATSVVLLAVDPGAGVGARDERTGEIGVVDGAGSDGYVFTPLNPDAVVRTGDRLVTGPGTASSYVAGLALGTVRAVHATANGTVRADVDPDTVATQLDVVGVITGDRSAQAGRSPLTPSGGTR